MSEKSPKVYNKKDKNVPKDAVYVGRPSKWGNPYTVDPPLRSREQAVEYFRQYIKGKEEEVKKELKGKDLVCYCAPKACHADVLLEIANG